MPITLLRDLSRIDVSIEFMDESKASQFCLFCCFFLFFLSLAAKSIGWNGFGFGLDLDLVLDLDLG